MAPGDRVRSIRAGVVALAVTSFLVVASAPAHAVPDPFSVTPTSGGPGTEVTVSGTGCSPGLTNNSSDYVTVTATNPVVSLKLSVTNSGAWSGSFTVPSGALPTAAVLAAACFTNGLPSLLTTYAPQMFTVTSAPTPTTSTPTSVSPPSNTMPTVVTPGPGTVPKDGAASPPTTSPARGGSNGGNPDSTTPSTTPNGSPNAGGARGGSSGSSSNARSSSEGPDATSSATDRASETEAKVARTTDFTPAKKRDDLTWLGWMLLVLGLFIAGAVAMGLRWRHEERGEPTC